MRRTAVLALALLVVASGMTFGQDKGDPAQSAGEQPGGQPAGESVPSGPVMPWHAPIPWIDDGSNLITIGFWADCVGVGLIAGAGPAYSISFGAGNTLLGLGLISLIFVGNECLQIGMTQHHDALVAQGYNVSTANREKAELFSRITLYCGAGSVGLGIIGLIAQSPALAITSNIVGAGGAILEIINFYVHRRNWGNDLRVAAGIPPLGQ